MPRLCWVGCTETRAWHPLAPFRVPLPVPQGRLKILECSWVVARQRPHVDARIVASGLRSGLSSTSPLCLAGCCSAWLDSGYMFFVGLLGCGSISHMFHVQVNSGPEVFFPHALQFTRLGFAEWRSVHSRCFSSFFARAESTWKLDTLSTSC